MAVRRACGPSGMLTRAKLQGHPVQTSSCRVILHSSWGGLQDAIIVDVRFAAILAIGCGSASHFSSEFMKALRL